MKQMRKTATAAMLFALVALPTGLSGCAAIKPSVPTATPPANQEPASQRPATSSDAPPAITPAPQTAPSLPSWVTPITDANFREVVSRYQPNELGKVLILEYHDFKDTDERWARSWTSFRKDLELLYAKGFRAVNFLDYLNGTMQLPAGTSPVIFTFDDSFKNQMKMIQKDGKWEVDPKSAVGIMLQFKKEHPDFGAAGSFYVNFTPVPFRETENWKEKLRFMVANGFEIGNHTLTHENLGELDDAGAQKALAKLVASMREIVPDYDGSTMALPFGIWPKSKNLAIRGEYDGVKYNHRAVLLVGSDPATSPYDKRTDVMALPRVQAIDSEFERWIPYLEKYRYVSDGDPATVVFPADRQEFLNAEKVNGQTVRTYKPADSK